MNSTLAKLPKIMAGMAKIIQRSEVKLTEEENQLLFDSGELAMELLKNVTPLSPATPTGYVLMGPEDMPTFPEAYPTLDELVRATARYMLRFQKQGHYRDMRMENQTLEWVADGMSVQTVPTLMTSTAAYTKYVNDNLERIGRDGWVPISYEEFLDSEECSNELYREEVSRPTSTEPDGWTFVGNAAVDAGMLMITDPCYINSEWKKDGKERPMVAPGYRHPDGTVLYFPGHGAAPAEGALPFEHYEAIVEKYGKTVNAMNAEGILTKLPTPAPSGEFSYTGACEATGDHNELQGGQLKFSRGHAGAGVVFRTGYGDGVYPVYLRYVHDGDWGTRVAEARVVFIDPSELDEDDDTYQESDTEWDEGDPEEAGKS